MTNDKCCEFGKYYTNNACTNLPETNCEVAISDNANGECLRCLKGFNLFGTKCCAFGKYKDANGDCVDNTIDNCNY